MNPVENLVGKVLDNGWELFERIPKKPNTSGGNFSVPYKARKDGKIVFVKVVNIARAFGMPNMMKIVETLTVSHNRECELLIECKDKRLDKIIKVLEHGEILPQPTDPMQVTIPYVIFELAEGSVRDELNIIHRFDTIWSLKCLHQIFVGIKQLHSNNIVHQDLKPSNVVLFEEKEKSKLADLGRADKKGVAAPHTGNLVAGDPTYAPLEQLYGYILADWNLRRQACDLYHLGSMITFFYSLEPMTNLIKIYLPSHYHWSNWKGNYRDVLPYLIDAYDNACIKFGEDAMPNFNNEKITNELVDIVRQLCHPDPEKRGHPYYKSPFVKTNPFLLEKYISRLSAMINQIQFTS